VLYAGLTECTNCTAGSWRNATGGTAANDCTNCTVGQYRGVPGQTSNTCEVCPAGKFGVSDSLTACTSCPAGSWSASGFSVCTLCTAGTYNSSSGQPQPLNRSCTEWSNSSYCAQWQTVPLLRCGNCPVGKFGASDGLTACTNCPAGSYADSTGLTVCTNCTTGKYGYSYYTVELIAVTVLII
jgi:hypothetical protein